MLRYVTFALVFTTACGGGPENHANAPSPETNTPTAQADTPIPDANVQTPGELAQAVDVVDRTSGISCPPGLTVGAHGELTCPENQPPAPDANTPVDVTATAPATTNVTPAQPTEAQPTPTNVTP